MKRTSRKPAKKTSKKSRRASSSGREPTAREPASRGSSGGDSGRKITVADVILEREFGRAVRSGGPGVVLLGLDLGTRRTAVVASRSGHPIQLPRDLYPTIVGSPRPGVVVAGGSRYVFANDAVKYQDHLDVTHPVREGTVHDMELCRKFVGYLRTRVDPRSREKIWTVASVPADSTPTQKSRVRQVLLGAFERVFTVPEPYLAALGMLRDGSSPGVEKTSPSSVLYSIVVDVGNRSTRLCVLQGHFPGKRDQIRIERGGSFMDEQILSAGHMHPGLRLTPELVRSIKEEQGIVLVHGDALQAMQGLHSDLLDLVVLLREACDLLLTDVVDGLIELLERRGIDKLEDAVQGILLTGRSSRIPGMSARFAQVLEERGIRDVPVRVPADHERLVARGALHVAEALGEEEWNTAEEEQRLQEQRPLLADAFLDEQEPGFEEDDQLESDPVYVP